MNEMNDLPKLTDQDVVNLVCELPLAAAPGSLGANLDVSPADYSRLNTASRNWSTADTRRYNPDAGSTGMIPTPN